MLSNVQKMKEAISDLMQMACSSCVCKCNGKLCSGVAQGRDALDLPLRQCDVGTPDEQWKRFAEYCLLRKNGSCHGCPVFAAQNNGLNSSCELIWAQIPYEPTTEGDKS